MLRNIDCANKACLFGDKSIDCSTTLKKRLYIEYLYIEYKTSIY